MSDSIYKEHVALVELIEAYFVDCFDEISLTIKLNPDSIMLEAKRNGKNFNYQFLIIPLWEARNKGLLYHYLENAKGKMELTM